MEVRYKETCFVEEINKETAKALVSKFHYLGDKAFMYSKAYGLWAYQYTDGGHRKESAELIGVAVFSPVTGISALKSWFGLDNQAKDIYELIRLVMAPEHNGGNGTSFLLGRSLRLLKKTGARGVVSLADSERHVGGIYQACNFKFYGRTAYRTDFYREDGKLNPRGETKNSRGIWLPRSQKYRYYYSFGSLQPLFTEESYPKGETFEVICCKGTNKVYDARFNTWYQCPKCVPNETLVEIKNVN